MELQVINEKICDALIEFYDSDQALLENDVHERTITASLCNILKPKFPNYHVDHEYNRMKEKVKRLGGKEIYPDIIVHHRGNHDNNLLVIEVEKATNPHVESDRRKIKGLLKDPFKYNFGLIIILYKNPSRNQLLWF